MKIIAHKNNGVVVELTIEEFRAVTGTHFTCHVSQMWQFEPERKVELIPLLDRVHDVLAVHAKLETVAETLRGLATVISTVDAVVPKGETEAAK